MRVNARLDDASQQQIDYLTQATGQSVSQVLREALAQYHAQVRSERGGMRNFMALMGTGDSGRHDVASNVKREIGAVLDAKHPGRRA